MRFRRKFQLRTSIKAILGLLMFSVLYNEVLIYMLTRINWSYLPCESKNCTRILLVADPQILGETYDTRPLFQVFNWDSDRFFKMGFRQAVRFAQPETICFLGDIFDEGSSANEMEYEKYVKRFYKLIDAANRKTIKSIFVPGDNDIGGENGDPITGLKVSRFNQAFQSADITAIKNTVHIIRINGFTHESPKFNEDLINSIRIGISHKPIMLTLSTFSKKVVEELKPHLIFSAHLHDSVIVSNNRDLNDNQWQKHYIEGSREVDVLKLNENTVFEILVPTCSYRMGVEHVGYGVAVIDDDVLKYSVLWMPNRFKQLYLYLIFITLCVLIFIYDLFVQKCRR